MGGKNPAIVMPSANLDDAAEGVLRSAFGLQGQKCSACSRVYVHEAVKERFTELLLEKTARPDGRRPQPRRDLPGAGDPRAGVPELRALRGARPSRRAGAGGRRACCARATSPTATSWPRRVVDGLPKDHALFREEMFVPIVCLAGGRLAGRGAAPGQPHRVRADRRLLQRDEARDPGVPRPRSRRGSSTSTGGPAPRPGPGRACSPSAAGRAAAPRARPRAGSTTSSSSCGSSPAPSSIDARELRGRPLPGLVRVPSPPGARAAGHRARSGGGALGQRPASATWTAPGAPWS